MCNKNMARMRRPVPDLIFSRVFQLFAMILSTKVTLFASYHTLGMEWGENCILSPSPYDRSEALVSLLIKYAKEVSDISYKFHKCCYNCPDTWSVPLLSKRCA